MEQSQVGFRWADSQKAVDLPDDTNRVLSVNGREVLEQRVGVVVVQVPVLVEPGEHEVIESDDVVARMSVGHRSIFAEEERPDVPFLGGSTGTLSGSWSRHDGRMSDADPAD